MGVGEYSIKAELRDLKVNPRVVRRSGSLPAIIYGKGINSVSVQVDTKTFRQVYRQAGESSLIKLEISGEDDKLILFKEPQFDPRTEEIIHIDFYQVKLGEKIKTDVPLVFEGEAPAVEEFDGVLITNKDKVEIECLPRNLPHEIKVDLSGLTKIDDAIFVKNLKPPEGVEVLDDPEDSIVVVTPQRAEEAEPEVTEEKAVSEIEVEGAKDEGDAETTKPEAGEPKAAQDETTDEEASK